MEEKDLTTLEDLKEYIHSLEKSCEELSGDLKKKEDELREFRKEEGVLKNDKHRMYVECVACLRAVKALVENSHGHGSTHRMRDFYCESISTYILNAISTLDGIDDPYPF